MSIGTEASVMYRNARSKASSTRLCSVLQDLFRSSRLVNIGSSPDDSGAVRDDDLRMPVACRCAANLRQTLTREFRAVILAVCWPIRLGCVRFLLNIFLWWGLEVFNLRLQRRSLGELKRILNLQILKAEQRCKRDRTCLTLSAWSILLTLWSQLIQFYEKHTYCSKISSSLSCAPHLPYSLTYSPPPLYGIRTTDAHSVRAPRTWRIQSPEKWEKFRNLIWLCVL